MRTVPSEIKKAVWERDKYFCFYCGKKLNIFTATVDHVVPQSTLSGKAKENMDNLVTACKPCNQLKGAYVPDKVKTCVVLRAHEVKRYGL